MRRIKSGISTATAAMVGILVAVMIGALLIASRMPIVEAYPNVAKQAVAAIENEARIRLSLAYYVGDKIAISNDGDLPVKIVKLIVDGANIEVDLYIKPGEVSKEVQVGYTVGSVAAVLDDGRMIPLLSNMGWGG